MASRIERIFGCEETNHAAKKRVITGIFGKTGWGKGWIIREHLNLGCKREIIVDTMNEHDEAILFDDVTELIDYVCAHKIFCVRATNPDHADYIYGLCLHPGMEGTTITVEEAYLYFPSRGAMEENAQKLIFAGRHCGINMNLTFQRAKQCSLDLRSQLDNIITFRQSAPEDARYMRDLTGYALPDIQTLQPGECYVVSSNGCTKYFFHDLKKYVDNHLENSKLELDADQEQSEMN